MFGIDTVTVQEILPYQAVTPVPLAPAHVKGLINLRGQIVTVLDLRRCLDFDRLQDEVSSMNLLVNSDEGTMSLLVDQIGNVVDIPSERLAPPPGIVRGVAAQYIQHVCQLEEDVLIVLDVQRILHTAN